MNETIYQQVIQLAVEIQQIAAPTFAETARAQFVRQMFAAEGLTDIEIDSTGNALARLTGEGTAPPLVVSAHLDTVFPAETPLTITHESGRIYGPGIGDNSLGVAGLFGLLWHLKARGLSLPGDLWLAANTGEEGLGDLKGMKAVCERFGAAPKAYLVLEGMALGHIYHRGIGVRRYKITLHTPGGHSWSDYGKPSAIHEMSRLVYELTALHIPSHPRTTLNVGRIHGGTSINTVAAQTWCELDLRSESPTELNNLARRVEALIETIEQPGVRVETQVIGSRPVGEISPSHPVIRHARTVLSRLGLEPRLTAGSTDANIPLGLGYPALVLGLTRGNGAHTLNEYIETSPLEDGLEQLFEFVSGFWQAV